jgi:signal transduction histidine kinase
MMPKVSLQTLSHIVFGYMLLAFGWWAYHLWTENDRLFDAEQRAIRSELLRRGEPAGHDGPAFVQQAEYQRAERQWRKSRRMVVAEGLFITACLLFGLWRINRSASREVELARQRRNFLLSITHELKSPIASMRLIFDTLRKHQLQPQQREMLLGNGLKDAARLQNLVEDLLLAARLEDNWQPLPEPVELAPLVREIARSLQVRFPAAQFQMDIPAQLPPVQLDKAGLAAIVQNLLENALKYSPEASPVLFKAEKLPSGKLRMLVADQGHGVPDAEKSAIFEKFYRLGSEETRQTTGTGLGLYIVRRVALAHGGTVQVGDNQPKGTVFTVEI